LVPGVQVQYRFAERMAQREHCARRKVYCVQQDLRKAYNAYCDSKDIAPLGPDVFAAKVLEVRPGVISGQNPHGDAIFIGLGPLWMESYQGSTVTNNDPPF
jgi:hypothetical protein